ncbi:MULTISPECIES: LysR family transcriptional regulator [Alcaligenes]|jgi:LysR family nitrogen assimilation transcriptional regulator|uniref:LysR substrate-binding domain-containing protein n=3 Tax=Alcaligenes TaxID=507 RepID=A0ABY4NKQ3_9BURK|nr:MULTISPECIES: LysR substrate-binding domain-containing protein [Alcaligenes]ERI35119.2 hypothetical protein N879_06240 [Alcaligenes sp. EGD-AK7]MCC9163343.1 LysR substrate-binding domain-containing protein [Alcaligenes sp. MMA]MCH4224636.1 LysR substrate-binding domain-containing protein [Alcaligenes faecalis]MCR4146116.1 LysR substrate-binding domain-containing protein [Alcaligenes faecalis]MCX5566837.1 LysR substrate-binding domain-containing protein [Alcaligenes phenolicus]
MSKKHSEDKRPMEYVIDLKQLSYFTHVAELGSYTRAAEFTNVAQPVLSRQIRKLEIDLRQNLLIRHGRGVMLTDAGKILLKHSRLILRQLEQAQEDLSLSEGKLTGHMYLGLPPTVARTISLDVVQAFKEQLPDAHLTIIESLTVNLEEQIHLDRVNMGLLYNPSSSPTLETQLLAEEQLHLICGVDSPYAQGRSRIALKDLADIPLIMPSLSNSFRMLVEKEMQKLNLKPQIEFEINSVGVIIQLLAKGMGAAILSRSVLEFIPQSGLLTAIPIEQPALVNRLYLAYSSKRLPTKLQVKVRQILIDICQRHFPGRDD